MKHLLPLLTILTLPIVACVSPDAPYEDLGDDGKQDKFEVNPNKPWCGPANLTKDDVEGPLLTLVYDADGRLMEQFLDTGPDREGLQVKYSYDDQNRVVHASSIGDAFSRSGPPLDITFLYNSDGLLAERKVKYHSGAARSTETYSYDAGALEPYASEYEDDGGNVHINFSYTDRSSHFELREVFDADENVHRYNPNFEGTRINLHTATPHPRWNANPWMAKPLPIDGPFEGADGSLHTWQYNYKTTGDKAVLTKILDTATNEEILVNYECD